jgi:pyridoxamine 5'-phosphate oxidase
MEDLSNYRKSYEKSQLSESEIPEDPINLFHRWFHETEEIDAVGEVNAMTVSTIGLDGYPKSRIVLLKKYNEEGFIFYTNYNSEKGKAIAANPKVSLSFFWPIMERQVIIKGMAEKTSATVSDAYFESRPEGSRLGAIVSNQSEIIQSREQLEEELRQLEQNFHGKEILRPKHWGGYLVKPLSVEFWQGRPNRLHDRIRYQLENDFSWSIERLAP